MPTQSGLNLICSCIVHVCFNYYWFCVAVEHLAEGRFLYFLWQIFVVENNLEIYARDFLLLSIAFEPKDRLGLQGQLFLAPFSSNSRNNTINLKIPRANGGTQQGGFKQDLHDSFSRRISL